MARPPAERPALWRYGLAFVACLGSFGTRMSLDPVLGNDAPLLISIVAVAFSAWYGGFGPGLLATLLSIAGAIVVLATPWGTPVDLTDAVGVRLFMFLVTGTVLSGLTEALHQTAREWRRAEQEHENRILHERERLAREIHDTLAQGLTGIVIQLEAAEDSLDERDVTHADDSMRPREHLARARGLARESLAEARRAVRALRPQVLEQRDLPFALEYYLEQMAQGTGVRALLSVEGSPAGATSGMSAEAESDLLRIGLEAFTNSLRHAQASEILVRLQYEENLVRLSVTDDGQGFTPSSRHDDVNGEIPTGFGLISMRERAARIGAHFQLTSSPGCGTEVAVSVPIPPATSLGSTSRTAAAEARTVPSATTAAEVIS
jgi:signal transduction histidine kinase